MKQPYACGLLAILLLAGSVPAVAQNYTVKIEDGAVFIDGRKQRPQDLPSSLELKGLTASLSLSGPAHFRMGDHTYHVMEGRLVESDPGENDFTVFLTGPEPRQFRLRSKPEGAVWTSDSEEGPISVYYEILDGRLKSLNELNAEFSRRKTLPVAERLGQEAEEAALMVRAFPQLELQTYLEDIQNRNEPLYDDLLREHVLEMETVRLASRIRTTADANARDKLHQQLRTQLQEIFELKQQNRREEIDQLSSRLAELRTQMDARQSRRNEIIERRIQELLQKR